MNTNPVHNMNKRAILRRMLRFAANYLGVKRVELLDPLVTLFVESLAEEVYKLFGEIGNIEARMLETLSGMLCSDISLSAHPSHCILYVAPDDKANILTKETHFTLRDKQYLPEGQVELSFYPVCNTKIRNGGIRYVVHDGLLYQMEEDQSKTLISRSRDTGFLQRRSYWIALELNESINTLENLSFYFDFPGVSNKNDYLHMLPFMQWKLNGKMIDCKQGLYTIESNQRNDVVGLFHNLDISEKLDQSILDFYNKHFLTITDNKDIRQEKKAFPEELVNYFPGHLSEDFTNPLIWFEIEYPLAFKTTTTEVMTASINAFPVANKHLHRKTIDVNNFLPVIPLETDNHESLLSIHSVVDAKGRIYYELPFDDIGEEQYKTYSLRRGGYERYSKREVREYLTNLANSLESHSSVKSDSTSQDDDMEVALSQVYKLVKHIRKRITRSKEKLEIQNYILIDVPDENDVFFVKYWTTNCEQANKIKQNTVLDCVSSDISVVATCVYTLTGTTGGKYAPQSTERQNLRIKSLMDRSVLVTNEDIIQFCSDEFSDLISGVRIAKGMMESTNEKGEFIRTTDVILTPKKGMEYLMEETDTQKLELLLQKNSPATFNYRVCINKN
ncbi:MAG: hypothetical protein ACK5KL_20430 [Dysgonomonas sp.]